jgi:hypothetical protein
LEDTTAQILDVPAGLAEEAMEGAEVLELGEVGGLNNAGQGTAPGTEDPGASQSPEGIKAGPSEAGLEGEQEGAKERTKRSGMRGRPYRSSLINERQVTQKKTLPPPALPFLEQLQIYVRDLLQYFLQLSERAQAFLDLFLQLTGNRDLAHLAIAETDGENPNRPVAFALALLAEPATGFIAAHHAAQ